MAAKARISRHRSRRPRITDSSRSERSTVRRLPAARATFISSEPTDQATATETFSRRPEPSARIPSHQIPPIMGAQRLDQLLQPLAGAVGVAPFLHEFQVLAHFGQMPIVGGFVHFSISDEGSRKG